MKKVLFSAFALAVLATSCKKDDDNNNTTATNSWKLNGTQYNTVSATGIGGLYGATSNNPTGYLFVDFSAAPTANANYTVVNDNATVGTNQISFSAGTSANDLYHSTGSGNVTATVTVNSGKITVSCPDVWMKKDNGTDSVKLSVNLTQTN